MGFSRNPQRRLLTTMKRISSNIKKVFCLNKSFGDISLQNTNISDLGYIQYLNGYRKIETRKREQVTWLDIAKTCVFLTKINVHILSYNFKAVIQHSQHLNFGLYFPSDLSTFLKITKTLKKTRGF